MNYTRTDLRATTSYYFSSGDQTVQWNATLGSFNGFDGDFETYWINFTVPESWENITAYNATEEYTDNIQFGREFQISPAGNSTNWFITAEVSRLLTDIDIISKPDKITPGDYFDLRFYVSYINGSNTVPIQGVEVMVETFINGEFEAVKQESTDEEGFVSFRIFIPNGADSIYLTIDLPGTMNYTSTSFQITDITVVSPPETTPSGINLSNLLPIFIIIGVVVGGGVGVAGVYKGVIVPKKQGQQNELEEIKTIFDDAINMEYIVVIYKESGVSLYFKSMGTEKFDPDLISGFISAVSSFGKTIELDDSLSEMKYGDKAVVLSDGEYIRAAVVLNKKASELIKKNLRQFVVEFEEWYAKVLPEWRNELRKFKDAGDLVDKFFNTSIILPHIVKYTSTDIKNLEYNVSKNILYEAETLLEEPGRDFFFIGKLLKKVKEETEKDLGEIFRGIKEVREKKLLIPIELSELEGDISGAENRKGLQTTFAGNT